MTDPMEDLRAQFVAAAREQARPSRGRRWWRNRIAILLGVLLASGAVADGVDLGSRGDPINRSLEAARLSGVKAGGGRVDATVTDPERSLPFAVVTYRRDGKDCVTVGQLRGSELGELRNGVFHSYEGRIGGACRAPSQDYVLDPITVDGRSLIFGRAVPGIPAMLADHDGKTMRAKTGPHGGFLFVFDEPVSGLNVQLRAAKR